MSVKTCESLACVAGAALLRARGTRKGERRQLSLISSPPFYLSRARSRDFSVHPENNRCLAATQD